MKTRPNRCPHCWSSLPESVGPLCLHCGLPLDHPTRRRRKEAAPPAAEPVAVSASRPAEPAEVGSVYRSPWGSNGTGGTVSLPPASEAPEAPVLPPPPDLAPPAPTHPAEWAPPAGDPTPVRRRRRSVVVIVVAALVAAAASAGGWYFTRPDGPSFPSGWDPRVTDLVAFVERERDLRFRHPVHIDFLPEAEFRQLVTNDGSELSAEEREEMEAAAAMFRALGLLDGEVDLFEAANQLTGEGVLAFYDLESERIRVRGTELTMGVRGTLVHELTHVLQDQVFDLEREFPIEAQNEMFPPVYEGDASRLESAWVGSLSEAEQAVYAEDMEAQAGGMDLSGVPEALSVFFGAPYQFGEPFIDLLVAHGGERAVDEVLESPPTADAQLLDPFRYLLGEGPADVDEPELAPGEERTDGGPFGAFGLFVVLAQHLDAHQALAATDAWGGDAYVLFEQDARHCVRAAFTGKDADGTTTLGAALDQWASAMPAGAATVSREAELVQLNSCDPGSEGRSPEDGRLSTAMSVPVFRSYVGLGVLEATGSTNTDALNLARCGAAYVIAGFSPNQLEEIMVYGPTDEFVDRSFEAGEVCTDPARAGTVQFEHGVDTLA